MLEHVMSFRSHALDRARKPARRMAQRDCQTAAMYTGWIVYTGLNHFRCAWRRGKYRYFKSLLCCLILEEQYR